MGYYLQITLVLKNNNQQFRPLSFSKNRYGKHKEEKRFLVWSALILKVLTMKYQNYDCWNGLLLDRSFQN